LLRASKGTSLSPDNTATPQQSVDEREAESLRARQECEALAHEPRILERVGETVEQLGLVGDHRLAKLIFLIATSRLLDHPVCAVIKGPSSAGKSFVLDRTLKLFPSAAVVRLSSMSEKALAYLDDDLKHKMLVVAEAAGLSQGMGAYLLRSLISEGRLRHATVDTSQGPRGKLIEREGPTGLLVTTTASSLEQELETRIFSISTDNSPQQTANIMLASARKAAGDATEPQVDLAPWHALQIWLQNSEHPVVVPFAETLANTIPAKAVRLRRDFSACLALLQTHAVLHQASRQRDGHGRISATFEDYAEVYHLVHDLVAEGVRATVSPALRAAVDAVYSVIAAKKSHVRKSWVVADMINNDVVSASLTEVARVMDRDKSTASRHVNEAIEAGYIINLEAKLGRPARLVPGDPLPSQGEVLPTPEALRERCCGVAPLQEEG
jgi:hypothetical protein